MLTESFGFAEDEIDTSAPTRSARLKWVVVVDGELEPGRAVNAAACVAAATGRAVSGMLGPDALDADGAVHPGLPWAGCTVLSADRQQLKAIRSKAATHDDVLVVDMPVDAQLTRVYDEYLSSVSAKGSGELEYHALGIVGPRNRVDRMVGRLPLMA
ncbi:DUF2000 domain-containing protein [Rathayibacter sp. KR2-224]|uniref:DUF2000 domain-containing protein n=1 Tax=Rathayibacter sp. KR2-224 TaxID=3400913 RepID=UPI003C075FB1